MTISFRVLKALVIAMLVFAFTSASSQEQPIGKFAQVIKAEGQKEQGSAQGQDTVKLDSSPPSHALATSAKVPFDVEQPIAHAKSVGEQTNEKKEESWLSKLLADPIAFFTFLLFLATLALWYATRRLVLGAEDTAQRQLRAYVSIRLDGNLFYCEDGMLSAQFITKNNGVTPAHGKVCSLNIGLFRFPLDTELDPPTYSPTSSNSALFPGEQVRQYPTLPSKLNQAEIETIKRNEGAIFVWGEVQYMDAFNKQRSTRFRMYSTGADFDRGELAYHHEGNTAE